MTKEKQIDIENMITKDLLKIGKDMNRIRTQKKIGMKRLSDKTDIDIPRLTSIELGVQRDVLVKEIFNIFYAMGIRIEFRLVPVKKNKKGK
jgi:hypothetical protein